MTSRSGGNRAKVSELSFYVIELPVRQVAGEADFVLANSVNEPMVPLAESTCKQLAFGRASPGKAYWFGRYLKPQSTTENEFEVLSASEMAARK